VTSVGFAGLGNMGTPMCGRLLAAGYEVRGYDPDPRAGAELAGLRRVASVAELGPASSVIILMLPNSDVVEAVLLGDGLLDRCRPGTIVVDMGSSEPARTRNMARLAARSGIGYVDAPVSGGVRGAVNGTLTIMAAGEQPALTAVGPLLDILGGTVIRVGGAGAGHAAKALNNLMSAGHLWLTSEALAAATAFGLDPRSVLDVVNTSSGRSGSTESKWPDFILTDRYDSGFGLRLMLKDVGIGLRLVREMGVPAMLSEAVAGAWERAARDMPANADHTEVARWIGGSRTKESGGDATIDT
jgi:3-hydroxyisobutyrate dehydrogenase